MRVVLLSSAVVLLSIAACTSDAEMKEALRKYDEAPPRLACSQADGRTRIDAMKASSGATARMTDGWMVVRIGSTYDSWSADRAESWIRLYADGDACASGAARKLEFQAPNGKVIGRADPVRGIQITR